MLYYARTIVNTENTKFEPTGKGGRLMLWNHWWNLVCELRSACARTRTFLWMSLCLAGMTTRKDLQGVTSIVRSLGLEPAKLRPPPGLLPQLGPGSRQAHPRLVRIGLPARPRDPARQRQTRSRRRWHQGRQGRTQDARRQKAPSTIRVKQQGGVHLRPLLPSGRCAHPSLVQRIGLAFG